MNSSSPESDTTQQGISKQWYTKIMNWYRWSSVYIPFFNVAARTGLRLKASRDQRRIAKLCAGRSGEVDDWFNQADLFFGFSSNRVGSVFLANMLKIEVPDSHIEHEANIVDYWQMQKARSDEESAYAYVSGFRRNEIFQRSSRNIKIYGEINPLIRRHCLAFKTVFPDAKLFHMVRDPKETIRSNMSREILSNKDPMTKLIRPKESDPYFSKWKGMSRFEKVCWEWQDDNRYIRKHVSHVLRFEDMMSNYDVFKSELLDYLGIEITHETWSRYISSPRNVSRKHRFGNWKEWSESQKATFKDICGAEAAEYGYES